MGPKEYSKEWWKERLPFIQAFVGDKNVHVNVATRDNPHRWVPVAPCTDFHDDASAYRIVPEPKLRPWKPEEVPVGALWKDRKDACFLIIARVGDQIMMARDDGSGIGNYSVRMLCSSDTTHSTDGGKTWNPCGVLEE